LSAKYNFTNRPQKAIQLLKSAGFKRGSDGIFRDKKGHKLSLKLNTVGGYTDWASENGIISQDLAKIGIAVTPANLAGNTHSADEQYGQFQLDYEQPLGGPTPYYQYRQLLDSANTAAIGKLASSNFERYSSKYVDKLFAQYAQTSSSKIQHAIIDKLQAVMLQQVPVIPVLESVNWYEYDTSQITGWVTATNNYAAPAAYNFPDVAQVLLRLHLK
jgi:peptide/nickel transport system substrate-binding protein